MIIREVRKEFDKTMSDFYALCIEHNIDFGVAMKVSAPFRRFHLYLFPDKKKMKRRRRTFRIKW